jgi:hypothetical protein
MIAVHLDEMGYEIQHILKDSTLASHGEMEAELLKKYAKKLPQPSLFEPEITEKDQRLAAYRLHNAEVGWSVES